MSARGDNPQHHFIRDGRFVCTAPPEAGCRNYPSCECEAWSRELHGIGAGAVIGFENGHALYAKETIPPAPGHEDQPQDECWITPWIEACDDLGETYDSDDGLVYTPGYVWPDGPVTVEWDGDDVTWTYADNTKPQREEEE